MGIANGFWAPAANTRLYGVIGDPVAHSLSPLMHNAAFRETGHNGVYVAFQVRDLPGAVAGIRALNVRGCSVTIPHKVAVMALLDDVDPVAQKIGAVNTIVNEAGRLIGFNTDSPGAVAALREATAIAGRHAVVVGAGGAARAVAFGIVRQGGRVTIVNRSEARGRRLAEELDGAFVSPEAFTGDAVDILVNTTSVGMTPHVDGLPVPASCLRPGMTVMDIVYNPLQTRLLRSAHEAGCRVVDGVAMFVHQGALQFARWTGEVPPLKRMQETVIDALTLASDQGSQPTDTGASG